MNPNSNQRISMRILAERLGVTKTTISLALRGHPNVSEKTRQRVVELAKELNYRPDPAISAIASQRWSSGTPERHRVIAFLAHLSAGQSAKIDQLRYRTGAERRARDLGYKLETFLLDDYPSAQAVTRVLYSRGIRGIIIPPICNPDSKRAMQIDWSKFTAVCCGIGRVRPNLHTVSNDTFSIARRVWDIVVRSGFKRIGAAIHMHDPVADDDWNRYGASMAAMNFHNIPVEDRVPIHTGSVLDGKSLVQWYERYKPDVVIGFNSRTGEHLEEHGVRIPEDTQFVALIAESGSKWSGVSEQHDKLSETSMDLLYSEICANNWGEPKLPNITLINPEWNKGSTFLPSENLQIRNHLRLPDSLKATPYPFASASA